jgi:DNA polymerase
VDSDSSQIEARTLAWLSNQSDLVKAFDEGKDVYKIMASTIYNKNIKDITKEERFVGKTTILGAGYGMGAEKFKNQLKTFGVELDIKETEYIIQTYRSTYAEIPRLWRKAQSMITAIKNNKLTSFGYNNILIVEGNKGIKLPNGMYIKYDNIRNLKIGDGKEETVYDIKRGRTITATRLYGGKVIENVCQALARIVIGEQMLKVSKKYKVVMTVHDAITCIVKEEEVEEAKEFIGEVMRERPTWAIELPLDCEVGTGKNYGACS